MNNFSSNYLELLKRQVQEEIEYLVVNSHENDVITTPCMFCVERGNSYQCRRLTDLRQFLTSIVSQKPRTQEIERRPMGKSLPIDSSVMPLLYPNI